jgi:hypothetical protein
LTCLLKNRFGKVNSIQFSIPTDTHVPVDMWFDNSQLSNSVCDLKTGFGIEWASQMGRDDVVLWCIRSTRATAARVEDAIHEGLESKKRRLNGETPVIGGVKQRGRPFGGSCRAPEQRPTTQIGPKVDPRLSTRGMPIDLAESRHCISGEKDWKALPIEN